jgi:hypothetical protein
MARASKGLSNQQSRAAESILPAAPNVLAKAKLESRSQAASNPQSLLGVVDRAAPRGGDAETAAQRTSTGQVVPAA